jgi:Icc-related predicted phosphoesterase
LKPCLFATDLHGRRDRYEKLFDEMVRERPVAVFLGGDLFPLFARVVPRADFDAKALAVGLRKVREVLGAEYPDVLLILGNDDARAEEEALLDEESTGLWHYIHGRRHAFGEHQFYGYAFVPPTPFQLKDWEKYDVGRYTPPGCVSPEEGQRTVPVESREIRHATIAADLQELAGDASLDRAVFLFHGPPHETHLDRAALDGKMVDHAPLDVHVGSIAVRRFIEQKQPYVTLHGHIHESARLTGSWRQRIGRTHLFGAAHDGDELALVRFDLDDPGSAERLLI